MSFGRQAWAQLSVWGDPLSGTTIGLEAFTAIGMGNRDPRIIIASVVQVILGFLGVLAVVLILYGGFRWMTAAGDSDKVDSAKKLLVNAVVGLLIILSAFAIATFVLRALLRSSGASDSSSLIVSSTCSPEGATAACGCGGLRTCQGGKWSTCFGSDCDLDNIGRRFCDGNILSLSCEAKDSLCSANEYCNAVDCRCSRKGGFGESCDSDKATANCQADNNLCAEGLECNVGKGCTCIGGPVITALSPLGGFCQADINRACNNDTDCAGLTPANCDTQTPNASVGNWITINGSYFLDYVAGVSKVMFYDGSDFTIEGVLASDLNINCQAQTAWSDKQIIVSLPKGVSTGPVKIISPNGSDDTANDSGLKTNLIINNLLRPGLCQLAPLQGKSNTTVNYQGANLKSVNAFFGSAQSNIKADNQLFNEDTTGVAAVPNIQSGLTSAFVRQSSNGLSSNYLQFTKEADEEPGPVIISVDPLTVNAGSYVTIRGRGFGRGQEFESMVYIGDAEAEFSFPPECLASVWSANQIIVKVPKGLTDKAKYIIKVKVASQEALASQQLSFDSSLVLAPSLCRIDPSFGQANEEISLWGEYFAVKNAASAVRFYSEHDQSGAKLLEWKPGNKNKADYIKTTISTEALSGPVAVIKNTPAIVGNSLNLTIGLCSDDSQCGGGELCCGTGTPAVGRCKANIEACYGTSATSIFEWDFVTASDTKCPSDRPNLCQDGLCCVSECVVDSQTGLTACRDDLDDNRLACSGFASALCLDSQLCPNSPGNCSFKPNVETKGPSCNCSLLGCTALGCAYDAQVNRCLDNNSTCSLPKTIKDINGLDVSAYCADYQGSPRWHLKTAQTCPSGYTKSLNNNSICVNVNETCSLCSSNLTCLDKGGRGICATKLSTCPSNFTCQNNVCTRSAGLCECCCDKNQNQPDGTNAACCAPLTCGNSCGTGPDNGVCSGCSAVGTTQAEHDNACICSGSSGKYCDTSVSGGVCNDCGAIGDPVECSKHETCCVDAKNGGACSAIIDGNLVAENGINYCGYLSCEDQCQALSLDGAYGNLGQCQKLCGEDTDDDDPNNQNCDASSLLPGCQKGSCGPGQVCNNNCKCAPSCDGDTTTPVCDQNNNLCQKINPNMICQADCSCGFPSLADQACAKPETGACSLFCGTAYSCRGEQGCEGPSQSPPGCSGASDEPTCRCCCDPNKKNSDLAASDFDKCRLLGEGSLSCLADKGTCTGQNRGLCCGCKSDFECREPGETQAETTGCSADACCKPRPKVVNKGPISDQSCRNPLIWADFDRPLDAGTLNGNVILIGDYGQDLCPDGSALLVSANNSQVNQSWLARIWSQFKSLLAQLLPSRSVSADGGNYCRVETKLSAVSISDNTNLGTRVLVQTKSVLKNNTNYYVIMKGDEQLNSKSGILDLNKIGFKGVNQSSISSFNGLSYPNAQIWNFKTGEDVCLIDRIIINPNSWFFTKADEESSFVAVATDAQNKQALVSTPIYAFHWLPWSLENPEYASLGFDANTGDSTSNAIVKASNTRLNGQTGLRASLKIDYDGVGNVSAKDQVMTARAKLSFFYCQNPWPPINNQTPWPWGWWDIDTNLAAKCDVGNDCLYNDFQIYYCRDKSTANSYDDLPALTSDPVIRANYQYGSGGQKIQVLKDFYLFREAKPTPPQDAKLSNSEAPLGGELILEWSKVADFVKYKVYYGEAEGNYQKSLTVTLDPADKSAKITIGKLSNNKKYYFAITTISELGVESAFSSAISALVVDNQAPATPTVSSAQIKINSKSKDIVVKWQKAGVDVTNYLIEYGPNIDPAVSVKLGLVTSYTVKSLNNLDTQAYRLRLVAIDRAGNKSVPAYYLCQSGCQNSCDCSRQ